MHRTRACGVCRSGRLRAIREQFMARSHAPAWERSCGRSSGRGFKTLERRDPSSVGTSLLPRWSVGARESGSGKYQSDIVR